MHKAALIHSRLAGCVYYEMRTGLKPLPDRRSFLSTLVSALKQAEGKYRCTVRLLVSVDRGASVEEAQETIDAAIGAFEVITTSSPGSV